MRFALNEQVVMLPHGPPKLHSSAFFLYFGTNVGVAIPLLGARLRLYADCYGVYIRAQLTA